MHLGLDVYSVRSQGWTPAQVLEFAAAEGVGVVHFSEITLIGSLDTSRLRPLRERADALGIDLEIGMRAIAATSNLFDAAQGTADEQIARMIDAARVLGSPLIRCFVGNSVDRLGAGGIERHLASALAAIGRVRSRLGDAGLKLAIENHSGDLQARELRTLIEAAGPDVAGACLDSGNPVWANEDPHLSLELLAPYVLTTHVRDSAVWMTAGGVAARWTRMGEGNIGIAEFIGRFAALCPHLALTLEIIVRAEPRVLNYRDPGYWDAFRQQPAWEFARFLTRCERGAPSVERPLAPGETPEARELADVRASLAWTRTTLAALAAGSS
jgi:sugar phosphate isomerase/epimerase